MSGLTASSGQAFPPKAKPKLIQAVWRGCKPFWQAKNTTLPNTPRSSRLLSSTTWGLRLFLRDSRLTLWLTIPTSLDIDICNGDSLVGGCPNVMASMAAVMEQMHIYFQFLQPYLMPTPPRALT
ncbi:hypothetical protein B0H14DRAFT_2578127 [Mycena olivaceomarginata]|nr:hypothetical protein B0H14DRAFT_2578127 [Mycena olivaceomarginata]